MSSELDWISKASQKFGSRIDLVQGTGGNISVKPDENTMLIKASGLRLSDVSASSGLVKVDHRKIASMYESKISEHEAANIVNESILDTGGFRPSIETGFHSFLGKYVVHLHPTAFNVIACCCSAKRICSEIFQNHDCLFVPYKKVGHILSQEIWDKNGAKKDIMIMLENHGIIASSDDPSNCHELVENTTRAVENFLNKSINYKPFVHEFSTDVNTPFSTSTNSINFLNEASNASRFLFPDAAIFTSHLFSPKKGAVIDVQNDKIKYKIGFKSALNIDEILSAHIYLIKTISGFDIPKYLTKNEITELLGMEPEKYRMRMLGI